MKSLTTALLLVGLMSCTQIAKSQDTWQVGNTTLTEIDLVTGVNLPWEILWGPDDYIWATTRPGYVIRINPETGNYTTILDKSSVVPQNGSGEPGMLGMALHPDFENNPKVYIVYNYMSGQNVRERLSMFDWDGTNLINEEYLITDILGNWIHDGSRLLITPDNKLLMSTGDKGDGTNPVGHSAQTLSSLNGKILRINLDGTVPDDNPIADSYVYSWGHRNGQGLCLGPNGIIYESEHGQSNSDELNILEPNRNFGWPAVQGACNTAAEITYCETNNIKEPIMEWSPCIAVNGIEYYNHPAIPEWQNSIIMAVLGGLGANYKRVAVLHMSADGLTVESEDLYFQSIGQRFRDVCFNPYTGSVYVACNGLQYPGNGPNIIKEFKNMAYLSVEDAKTAIDQTLELYPNPATTVTYLNFSDSFLGGKVSVYAFTGETILEQNISSSRMELNCEKWAAGTYFVRAISDKGTITKTFVIQ